jgi:putative transposase
MGQSLQCPFRMLKGYMPRGARIIIPGVAHHVTQRGNRQQKTFFSDDDRRAYIEILAAALKRSYTRCLAWCLMDNHIHLMLVPEHSDGLRASLSSTHTTYAQRINQREQMSGHLFQGRYASFAMDDRHMMVAARYIENNPMRLAL